MRTCDLCSKEYKGKKHQFWHLKNYYSINGCLCSSCMNKVNHSFEGKPLHPVAYRNALKKLNKKNESDGLGLCKCFGCNDLSSAQNCTGLKKNESIINKKEIKSITLSDEYVTKVALLSGFQPKEIGKNKLGLKPYVYMFAKSIAMAVLNDASTMQVEEYINKSSQPSAEDALNVIKTMLEETTKRRDAIEMGDITRSIRHFECSTLKKCVDEIEKLIIKPD